MVTLLSILSENYTYIMDSILRSTEKYKKNLKREINY